MTLYGDVKLWIRRTRPVQARALPETQSMTVGNVTQTGPITDKGWPIVESGSVSTPWEAKAVGSTSSLILPTTMSSNLNRALSGSFLLTN